MKAAEPKKRRSMFASEHLYGVRSDERGDNLTHIARLIDGGYEFKTLCKVRLSVVDGHTPRLIHGDTMCAGCKERALLRFRHEPIRRLPSGGGIQL